MNKDALIEKMTKLTGFPKTTCKECLEAFMNAVTSALKQNEEVALTGFGTFQAAKRAARTVMNPATGKKMNVPARRVPKFKAGKALKDAIK